MLNGKSLEFDERRVCMRSTSTRSMIIDRKQRTLKWFMSLRYVVSNAAEASGLKFRNVCIGHCFFKRSRTSMPITQPYARQRDKQTAMHHTDKETEVQGAMFVESY